MKSDYDRSLCRLIEEGIVAEFGIPKPGLWLGVDRARSFGRVPHRIEFVATAHFTLRLIPLCCGELDCHLNYWHKPSWGRLGEFVRRRLRLRQEIEVEMVDYVCIYHRGVTFHRGRLDDELREPRLFTPNHPDDASRSRNWSD